MFSQQVRDLVFRVTHGFCEYQGCCNRATEFHHKVANTKVNQKLYPLFLQSIFNCMAICNDCHMTKPKVKISDSYAEAYEIYLTDLKKNTKARKE